MKDNYWLLLINKQTSSNRAPVLLQFETVMDYIYNVKQVNHLIVAAYKTHMQRTTSCYTNRSNR